MGIGPTDASGSMKTPLLLGQPLGASDSSGEEKGAGGSRGVPNYGAAQAAAGAPFNNNNQGPSLAGLQAQIQSLTAMLSSQQAAVGSSGVSQQQQVAQLVGNVALAQLIGSERKVLILPEGRYEGEVKNDKPHGKGKLIYTAQDDKRREYEGDFVNGLRQGKGVLTFKKGDHYEGAGIQTWAGNRCEGNFLKNVASGTGSCIYATGKNYHGQWANDKPHGKGTMRYPDGTVYTGDWKEGVKHGQGEYVFVDKGRYQGAWENDQRHGKGKYTYGVGEWMGMSKAVTYENGSETCGSCLGSACCLVC